MIWSILYIYTSNGMVVIQRYGSGAGGVHVCLRACCRLL